MTQEIRLAGSNPDGLCACVDDEDHERVAARRWYLLRPHRSLTVYAQQGSPTVYLHRLVLDAQPGEEIDHIDGNGLNCTRANLRKVTHSENMRAGMARKSNRESDRLFDLWEGRL